MSRVAVSGPALVLRDGAPESIDDDRAIRKGQWYWVKESKRDGGEWLGCLWKVGTNHAEVRAPQNNTGYHQRRVHFDEFHKVMRFEPHAEVVIARNVAAHQGAIHSLLEEVRALSARLGLVLPAIGVRSADPGTSLAVMSATEDVKRYSRDLVVAKEKTLPALFEKIKDESEELNRWLLAGTMAMKIEATDLKSALSVIDDRIFNISLYVGLTEDVECVRDGTVAPPTEKLRILQRRLYMDEECLLNYKAGGMVFSKLEEFDHWISLKENRDRILPFPRCLVAMRVRRNKADREAFDLETAFVNFQLGELDKLTFLYIRNGDQVWRLSCDQNFGEMLFPDRALYESGRPMMMLPSFGRVEKFMATAEFDVLVDKQSAQKAKAKAWSKAHPRKHWMHNPYRNDDYFPDIGHFCSSEWEPFDPSSVYFDDATRQMTAEIAGYNRIVLILQGLFDRSAVLHPHPPVNLWRKDHLDRFVELVSDAAGVLYAGDKPDFAAYRDRLNASISRDSVLVGQHVCWQERMAELENARDRQRGRGRSNPMKRFSPYGNPGPSDPGTPAKVSLRKQTALFAWKRARTRWSRFGDDAPVTSTVTVPFSRLLNVSAYQPDDYKQFFRDPRTRQEYLQWAPLLLAAEDHIAGKRKRRNVE